MNTYTPHENNKIPLKTIALGIGLSLAFATNAYSDSISIDGPTMILETPPNGPFASEEPVSRENNRAGGPILRNAKITSSTSDIIVRYASPDNQLSCGTNAEQWSAQAQRAFSFAANIWASQIHSTVPIVVDACWSNMAITQLGGASPRIISYSWHPQLIHDTWYPTALANAITKQDLRPPGNPNTQDQDIKATFNRNIDWYFGTDANPPSDQFDFVSVVLHELAHGLGHAGGATVQNGIGTVHQSSKPYVFSHLTKDGNGRSLLDYTSNSIELGDALTGNVGNGVSFHGVNAMAANSGNPIPLYIPNTWRPGASYTHLSDDFDNTVNNLMTRHTRAGDAQHTPGPISVGILRDLGWPIDRDWVYLSRLYRSFSFDPTSNNWPLDSRGTRFVTIEFTNRSNESLTNVYLFVKAASFQTLNNATTSVNNGGRGSTMTILNSSLPGGDSMLDPGEKFTVSLVIDMAGRLGDPSGYLFFDMLASTELQARTGNTTALEKVSSFTIDPVMFDAKDPIAAADTSTLADTAVTAEDEAFATAYGCSVNGAGRSSTDPVLPVLAALAMLGFARRRKIKS